jgi:uncharacterized protein (DUF362 family)
MTPKSLVSIVRYEKPLESVRKTVARFLKTHSMTVVSLGIKNLKGMIDIPSRKKCHNTDPAKDLHFMVAKLAEPMPPMMTLLDGIYTSERGPNIDGTMHRSNLLSGFGSVNR